MKVLVTGATGFIGGYLTKMLKQAGYEVKVLARPKSDLTTLEPLDWDTRGHNQGKAYFDNGVHEP